MQFLKHFFYNGETNQKKRHADEGVHHLWAAFFVAKKVGKSVGGSEILQRAVQEGKEGSAYDLSVAGKEKLNH